MSVSHVLWGCSTFSSSRAGFERFDALHRLSKSSFIVGSEMWEDHFDLLLASVKKYVVNIRETWKSQFNGDDSSWSQYTYLYPCQSFI